MAPSQLLSTVAFSWEGQDASEVDITHWLTLVTFLPSLHHSGSDLPSLTSPDLSIFFLIWVFLIKPFSYCSWCSQGKNNEVVCHSLLQWTTFCQTSPLWPIHLGWPHTAWLSFIELDKAVVHVIRLASVLWLWFHSVCPLMPSLSAYCIITAAPAKLSYCSLPRTWGISSWPLSAPAPHSHYIQTYICMCLSTKPSHFAILKLTQNCKSNIFQ